MSTEPTVDLKTRIEGLFQDAVAHHNWMLEETGENVHLVLQNEFRSGVAILDTLIDEHSRPTSREAALLMQQALRLYREELQYTLPLTRRRVELLLKELEPAEPT